MTAPCPICTLPMDDEDGGCLRHDPAEIAEWNKGHAFMLCHPCPAQPGKDGANIVAKEHGITACNRCGRPMREAGWDEVEKYLRGKA